MNPKCSQVYDTTMGPLQVVRATVGLVVDLFTGCP
jgi:hypothetical protein